MLTEGIILFDPVVTWIQVIRCSLLAAGHRTVCGQNYHVEESVISDSLIVKHRFPQYCAV